MAEGGTHNSPAETELELLGREQEPLPVDFSAAMAATDLHQHDQDDPADTLSPLSKGQQTLPVDFRLEPTQEYSGY